MIIEYFHGLLKRSNLADQMLKAVDVKDWEIRKKGDVVSELNRVVHNYIREAVDRLERSPRLSLAKIVETLEDLGEKLRREVARALAAMRGLRVSEAAQPTQPTPVQPPVTIDIRRIVQEAVREALSQLFGVQPTTAARPRVDLGYQLAEVPGAVIARGREEAVEMITRGRFPNVVALPCITDTLGRLTENPWMHPDIEEVYSVFQSFALRFTRSAEATALSPAFIVCINGKLFVCVPRFPLEQIASLQGVEARPPVDTCIDVERARFPGVCRFYTEALAQLYKRFGREELLKKRAPLDSWTSYALETVKNIEIALASLGIPLQCLRT